MKRSILSIIVFSVLTFSLVRCSSSGREERTPLDVSKDANKEMIDQNTARQLEIAEYVEEAQMEINENQRDIERLRAQKRIETAKAREEREARIAALEERNNELEKKLKNFKGNTAESLNDFKAEMKHDMRELGKALNELGSDNVPD